MPITVFVNGVTTIRVTLPEVSVVRVMPAPMVGPQGPQGLPGPVGPPGPVGADGNGIASTVDNGDGTFTITYDDGSTFTTPDFTGPSGPAGTITQVTSITVLQASWSLVSGLYEYDISDSNILSTSIVDVIPANADYATVVAAQVLPENVSSSGQVKIFAVNQPTTDFDVTINIFD
jgi:hypothetical protein